MAAGGCRGITRRHVGKYFGISKGEAATGIRYAWWEQGMGGGVGLR